MPIQILRFKALFSLNVIVYYLDRENASERQETALESIYHIVIRYNIINNGRL